MPDAWDDDEHDDFPPLSAAVKPKKEKIRDTWDDGEEEDKAVVNSAGKQDATRRILSKQTTPPVILKPQAVAPYNGGSAGSSFPPELSFEPAVRILKRPKATGPQSSSSSLASNDRQTLQEREEKYRQARERIFGSPSPSPSMSSTPNLESSQMDGTPNEGRLVEEQVQRRPSPAVPASFARPIREPLGPGSHSAFERKPVPERRSPLPSSNASS